MRTAAEKYSLLDQIAHDDDPRQGEEGLGYARPRVSSRHRSNPSMILSSILVISLLFNIYALARLQVSHVFAEQGLTRYAKLGWDTWVQYQHGGLYNSENETEATAAWDAIDYNHGSVALHDDYVAEMGLPEAQRFPWDENYGLYFLNGHHQLHCLKVLRNTMHELRDNKSLSVSWHHNMHCFNALRQEVLCTADDTPRYTSYEYPGNIGVGQWRMCRNWDKLEAWAAERTSCWRDINNTEVIDTLLRYRYCPAGSPYNERIHGIFGDFSTGPDASAST